MHQGIRPRVRNEVRLQFEVFVLLYMRPFRQFVASEIATR